MVRRRDLLRRAPVWTWEDLADPVDRADSRYLTGSAGEVRSAAFGGGEAGPTDLPGGKDLATRLIALTEWQARLMDFAGAYLKHMGCDAPIDGVLVTEMMSELRIAPVLSGNRGRPPASLEAVSELALSVARYVQQDPSIMEVELNPTFAYPDRAVPVDALVVCHT